MQGSVNKHSREYLCLQRTGYWSVYWGHLMVRARKLSDLPLMDYTCRFVCYVRRECVISINTP